MTNDALRETFFAECEELIEALTEDLDLVSSGEWDNETINAIFRAVHSIKGAAGAFGLDQLVDFAHRYETMLDLIRSNKLDITANVLRLMTLSADTLAQLVDCSRDQDMDFPKSATSLSIELTEITESIKLPTSTENENKNESSEADFVFSPLSIPINIDLDIQKKDYQIIFEPHASLYLNGHDPLRLFRTLRKLGHFTALVDSKNVPHLDNFDFDKGYTKWTINLDGVNNLSEITNVFSFVEGLCSLSIQEIGSEKISTPPPASNTIMEDTIKATPVIDDKVHVANPNGKPTANPSGNVKPQSTLRVDPGRVDRLINSVGELIINQAVINQNLKDSGLNISSEILATVEEYGTLARDIQEAVMAIRAQPVKSLFQRMGRVVREAAEATGKNVSFVTDGEATEIDKTMLERLADPLTHMLRNAVDHGIEQKTSRLSAGKEEYGTVKLTAAHRSGNVIIEIIDDGAGINRPRLLEKAIEKDIISADVRLTDSEIDALLFAPGFSTAESVTNLSGRGVGMDVVKTAITSLGGKVNITSDPGKGSTFTISLPLTLAVMDGMVVQVGRETMVIPLASVIETVRARPDDIHEAQPDELVLSVRGAYIPIADLGYLLGMNERNPKDKYRTFVLIDTNGTTIAIALEAIHDQRQVVIKSLEGNHKSVVGIAAATILGDGKIALIVDPEALLELIPRRKIQNLAPVFEDQL